MPSTNLLVLLFSLILISYTCAGASNDTEDASELYYYGIEESERGLPACSERQACSALLQRYWRPTALLRLCRCDRRQRCDTPATPAARVEINNRAFLQFCRPLTMWRDCSIGDTPLTVQTEHDQINPDEIEAMHHKNIQMNPPEIIMNCRCREPNYWKYNTTNVNSTKIYRCMSPPICKRGMFCGNVNQDMNALYQSCLCPTHHICVHSGGIPFLQISELLYKGKGWRATCQPVGDYSYEDY